MAWGDFTSKEGKAVDIQRRLEATAAHLDKAGETLGHPRPDVTPGEMTIIASNLIEGVRRLSEVVEALCNEVELIRQRVEAGG
jgi:hypothetical protein